MQVLSKGNHEFGQFIKEHLAYGMVDSTTLAPIKVAADGTLATSAEITAELSGVEAKLDTLHTDIATTLAGLVDGVEGKLDTLHTDLGTTLAGYLDGVETKLDALAANKARQVVVSGTIAGNDAYSQYDVMGDGASFLFAACTALHYNGGHIVEALLEFETESVVAGMGVIRLHLWNLTGPTIADNTAFSLAVGATKAATGYQGYIDFPTPEDVGSTLISQASASSSSFVSTLPKAFMTATVGTGLFGVLETRAAISGAVPQNLPFTIKLTIQPIS